MNAKLGADTAPLQFKRALWQPAHKSLLDTANLRDALPVSFARDSQPRKATSLNTILQNASRDRRILSASAGREHSFHAKFSRENFSNSSSIQKAWKDGGRRPPLQ